MVVGPPAGVEAAPSEPDTLTLGMVDDLAREHSPGWAQLESQFEASVQGARAEVRPANPSLGWDLEFLDEEGGRAWEQSLFMEKSFRLPAFRSRLMSHVDDQVSAAELERESLEVAWLSEARREFVSAAVAVEEVRLLAGLEGLIHRLEDMARARAAEEELSGVDLHLLELGQYQLRSLLSEARLEEDRRRARWEARMAMELPGHLDFDSEAVRAELTFPDEDAVLAWLEDSPSARADRQAVAAARGSLEVEEARRWPEVDLLAGVRQVTPGDRGFVLGAAIPLPIRDGNRAAVERERARERTGALEAARRSSGDRARARELLRTLEEVEAQLASFPGEAGDPEPFLDALVTLYEDGREPLSGVLGSVTLLADTYRSRFRQLDLYFDALFELEALTGRRLVAH
ncbi:MAG: TolC family protein [Gemmatimonadales bacterium]|nr:MAG: TolC family protein [Gemmatimonadales bacterium]